MSGITNAGSLIGPEARRDAIHIAVAPVVAAGLLMPGQHVGFVGGGTERVGPSETRIGIVDPFLPNPIRENERFWLFLYPNTITALRHDWTHPAFAPSPSEKWIRDFADSIPLDYYTLMSGAAEWVRSKEKGEYGEYLCFGGLLEGYDVPAAFWPHYEDVTGKKVAEDYRGSFFTCSC